MLTIPTPHFVLRDFLHADLDAYQTLRSDAKFQRFYSEEDSSLMKSAQLLQLFIEQSEAEPRTKFQLALCLPSGVLIGSDYADF